MAAIALLAVPAPAGAAEVTLEYEAPIPFVEPSPAYTLSVEAARGEANRLHLLRDERGFVVRERGAARIVAGGRCRSAEADVVRCAVPGGAGHVTAFVDAGDRNDVVVVGPLPGVELAEVLAGSGNDAVAGHDGADLLYGGGGRDWLGGLAGADRLDGGNGDDALDGGAGRDLVTYATRRAGVAVSLGAGVAGGAGEHDRLVRIEDAAGGRGSDWLAGDAGDNFLYGGPEGRDRADGGAGDDRVDAHRAIGGPGDDHLDGRSVACGRGRDVASRTRYQSPRGYGAACELVIGFYYAITRPTKTPGGLRLTLSCPIRRCSGTFAVADRRGRLAERRYSLRGEEYGGPGPRRLALRFTRPPAGPRGRFEISVRSLRRDDFAVGLR
jgi:hypothetical protein